jgi:hypothetical protein
MRIAGYRSAADLDYLNRGGGIENRKVDWGRSLARELACKRILVNFKASFGAYFTTTSRGRKVNYKKSAKHYKQ